MTEGEDTAYKEEALPPALQQLAAELDHLSGRSVRNLAVDGLPDLSGTDFRLTAQLGSGGFGTVYRAVLQVAPVGRLLRLERAAAAE